MKNLLIGDFEGPLDLLLHLIKKSKMDIYNIKIYEITEKYLEYIEQMKKLNLDVASEYLVMASELIEIKSKKLLPKSNDNENSDEYEENPEEELQKRLLEYKKYKESLKQFKDLESKRKNYFTKSPENLSKITNTKIKNDSTTTVFDLLDALKNMLERIDYEKPINTKISIKEISVKEKIVNIRNILKKEKLVSFSKLFEIIDRPTIVVTFLSVLQMAKNNEIIIKQDENFSEIFLERVD
jgi:segregation and condensation protein A